VLGLAAAAFAGATARRRAPSDRTDPAYSGQFADAATQQDNAIKLFMKQNGDTIAGKKIEDHPQDTAASIRGRQAAWRKS